MEMKQLFIRTKDEKTKEILLQNGFPFLNKEGSYYIFVNDGKVNFSEEVQKEVFYTDKLNV